MILKHVLLFISNIYHYVFYNPNLAPYLFYCMSSRWSQNNQSSWCLHNGYIRNFYNLPLMGLGEYRSIRWWYPSLVLSSTFSFFFSNLSSRAFNHYHVIRSKAVILFPDNVSSLNDQFCKIKNFSFNLLLNLIVSRIHHGRIISK